MPPSPNMELGPESCKGASVLEAMSASPVTPATHPLIFFFAEKKL